MRLALPACVGVLALLLVSSGCGSDDERTTAATTTPATPTSTAGRTATETGATTETETERAHDRTVTSPASTSPEDKPGGAGDEEPARTLAQFTAKDGRITPHVVRVPAFIAIRVELRSGDGADYVMSFAGKRLAVGGQVASTSTQFPGLKPNKALVGRPVAGVNSAVRVVASAKPGP